jgi:nucleoside-diphosphate-sugar epimerase
MILVTGASGLVGGAIYKSLAQKSIGTSFSSDKKGLIRIDLCDKEQVRHLFEKYSIKAVIHCASVLPNTCKLSQLSIYDSNIKMILNLLSFAPLGIPLVNISSTSVYNLSGERHIVEDSPIVPMSLYSLSKLHTEQILSLGCDNRQYLNLRISSPYSSQNPGIGVINTFLQFAENTQEITLWGSGKRKQAFTNVDKMAEHIEQLLKSQASGTFNYVSSPAVSMHSLAEMIVKLMSGVSFSYVEKIDPEDDCRCTISTERISEFVQFTDTLESDLKGLIEKLKI